MIVYYLPLSHFYVTPKTKKLKPKCNTKHYGYLQD